MHNYIQLVTKPALFPQDCQTIVYSFNIHFFGHCHIQRRLASGSIDLRATAIKPHKKICVVKNKKMSRRREDGLLRVESEHDADD